MCLKIMTFNVRGSFHEDGANNWDRRRALNVATIARYSPGIIGFQEAQSGNLETYAAELSGYDFELGALSIRQSEDYHRVPIFWKADQFEMVDDGRFYLSETPNIWSIGWNAVFPRSATWVKLRVLDSGAELVVLNTHFTHLPEENLARVESARLITRRLETISEMTCPTIVMADFNDVPGSDAYQVFMQQGYHDTFDMNGNAEAVNTFHDFRGQEFEAVGLRIDWILTKDGSQSFKTLHCEVITDEEPPLYPSDHYPVVGAKKLIYVEIG